MKRSDGLFLLAAIAGAAIFVRFYSLAFPAAAIDLKLPRAEVRDSADAYVSRLGIEPDTFLSTLTFRVRGLEAVFLQRTQGLEETSRFAREVLPLWVWVARWFRSAEKEEFLLQLGPDGSPLQFRHLIPEAAPGDSLTQDSARVLAAAFATEQLGVKLDEWRLVDQTTSAKDNRVDHAFTWERIGSEVAWRPDDPEAGTASLRLRVDVQGSQMGGFNRFLKVPEKFDREHEKETSVGTLLAIVSLALMALLIVAALIVGIARQKHDGVRWRWGLVAGLVIGAAVLLSGVLGFPLFKSVYRTETPFPTFVALAVVGIILGALLYGLLSWVTAASGESLAAETFPEGIRALRDWISGRWFSPAAGAEVLRGYAVAFAFLGYVTAFYLLGTRRLGIWLPADSPHNDLLSAWLPWLLPILVGIQASVSEEFVLRLFAISFVKRYLKVTLLALLIPAAVWAFGHSNYPVYPVYVRGIELTVAGLFFGWIFIRYGIVATLVAHYAIDAIFLAMPLLRASGGTYVGYGLAALACAALPLVVPVVAWQRSRKGSEAGVPR